VASDPVRVFGVKGSAIEASLDGELGLGGSVKCARTTGARWDCALERDPLDSDPSLTFQLEVDGHCWTAHQIASNPQGAKSGRAQVKSGYELRGCLSLADYLRL
jgi:hypothetical protein